jgi:small subunit ribosomal protein S8
MNIGTIRLLNSIKNASMTNTDLVCVNSNKLVQSVIKILYREGLILSFKVRRKENYLNNTSEVLVYLKYHFEKSNLTRLKIISSPSRKIHISYKNMTRISCKGRVVIFSTTKGLLTLDECRKHRVGGILLFMC